MQVYKRICFMFNENEYANFLSLKKGVKQRLSYFKHMWVRKIGTIFRSRQWDGHEIFWEVILFSCRLHWERHKQMPTESLTGLTRRNTWSSCESDKR